MKHYRLINRICRVCHKHAADLPPERPAICLVCVGKLPVLWPC